jgi:hypothetical protein
MIVAPPGPPRPGPPKPPLPPSATEEITAVSWFAPPSMVMVCPGLKAIAAAITGRSQDLMAAEQEFIGNSVDLREQEREQAERKRREEIANASTTVL